MEGEGGRVRASTLSSQSSWGATVWKRFFFFFYFSLFAFNPLPLEPYEKCRLKRHLRQETTTNPRSRSSIDFLRTRSHVSNILTRGHGFSSKFLLEGFIFIRRNFSARKRGSGRGGGRTPTSLVLRYDDIFKDDDGGEAFTKIRKCNFEYISFETSSPPLIGRIFETLSSKWGSLKLYLW